MEHRERPDRVADGIAMRATATAKTATVLRHREWSMVFVLARGAKRVYAQVLVVTTVTVVPDYTVTRNDVRRQTSRLFPVKNLFPVKDLQRAVYGCNVPKDADACNHGIPADMADGYCNYCREKN